MVILVKKRRRPPKAEGRPKRRKASRRVAPSSDDAAANDADAPAPEVPEEEPPEDAPPEEVPDEEPEEVKEEPEDEVEEVSMHIAVLPQSEFPIPVKDESKGKRTKGKAKAKPKAKNTKQAALRKPKLPQFAFEWFREKNSSDAEGQERPLLQLVLEWKNLSEEERGQYITLAEEDRLRFEREYEEWRKKKAALGKEEPALQDLLKKRRANLHRFLARVERPVSPVSRQPGRSRRPAAPEGFPKRPLRSAYALFCSEEKLRSTASSTDSPVPLAEAVPEEKGIDEGQDEEKTAEDGQAKVDPGARPGVSKLLALRKAWSNLSSEEKQGYAVRAAEDQERFRRELEAWRSDPANKDLVNQEFLEEAAKLLPAASSRKKLPRPRLLRCDLVARPETEHAEIMFDLLNGTENFLLEEQKAAAKLARAEKSDRHLEEAAERPSVAAFEDLGDAPEPSVDVDDLLGDLLAVEADAAESHAAFEAQPASTGGAFESSPFAQASAPGGPQLCLDESGNIVLNQSSLSRNVVTENPLEETADSNIQEAVSQYAGAYKKTPRCIWTASETELFYEALSLYGSDLFLVQTFFRNKSAGQIKTKYAKELKKNPKMVEEALTSKSKRLTKDTFEKQHGKIDTSKHYKPPPEPQPGDEPEQEVPLPEEEDDGLGDLGGMPPPEPEYCAEDESLTTNRLMALFD